MLHRKIQDVFFSLLQAGLWETPVKLALFAPLDYDALFRLAKEQSVIGLIAAGFEQVNDIELSEDDVVPFMHKVLHQESRNEAMDAFIGKLFTQLRDAGIRAVLVKGQGIAQCYARPRWRACGDIDLLLDGQNYEKAKDLLAPRATSVDEEDMESKHLGLTIDKWIVELHGLLHGHISRRADSLVEEVQEDMFLCGGVRVWDNEGVEVELPSPDNDVVFIFSHILQHFFRGGIGVRQICDWCRLLWTYRELIDRDLLASRICKMGMMSEWKAFAAFAVDYLGMPVDAMPFYNSSTLWSFKARRIASYILQVGNFGHNRDNTIYEKYPYLIAKAISFSRHCYDFFCHFIIFPLDSSRVFWRMLNVGIGAVAEGR